MYTSILVIFAKNEFNLYMSGKGANGGCKCRIFINSEAQTIQRLRTLQYHKMNKVRIR